MLAGCAASPRPEGPPPMPTPPAAAAFVLPSVPSGPLSCVPYARLVSGIQIFGDAWTWWDGAAGRYPRGHVPRPGAALVMRRTRSMTRGHVSVVTAVLGPREILVTHANWGNGNGIRGQVTAGVRVVDASPLNDWTAVRVWYEPAGAFGSIYAAYGFIYPTPGDV